MNDAPGDSDASVGHPRWFPLPAVQAFLVLSAIVLPLQLALGAAFWTGEIRIFAHIFVALAVITPFIALLWLAAGLAALLQSISTRRDWIDREK